MILELIIMKLSLDAIMQHCNSLAYEQELREEARQLKKRLLKLMSDYEAGAIDQKKYSEQEAEIMASLSKLTQQVSNQSGTQTFNTGLGL
ncbi:MAG: hypothetical protein E6K88_02415 [Thaumarchaeota archaeon]|nr:MAG: hypothetical protein E6K92_02570 [Nitrososphaerota archaeon]TLY11084.1 MAG: hypothetical protein E6K88_02415 [Nitrososphaerota archaeon]